MSDISTDIATSYDLAWPDLKERLQRAEVALKDLGGNRGGEDEYRLHRKQRAVSEALTIHVNLSNDIVAGGRTVEDAWGAYAHRLTNLLTTYVDDPGYYQGLGLALSYQHGYGLPTAEYEPIREKA